MAFDFSKVAGLLGSNATLGLGLGLLSNGWRGAAPGFFQGARLDAYNKRAENEQALQRLKLQQAAQQQQTAQATRAALLGPYVANPWTNPDNPKAGPQTGGLLDVMGLDPAHKAVAQSLIMGGEFDKLPGLLPKPPEPYTLTPGAARYGPNNQVVASVPVAPPTGMVRGADGSLQYDPNYLAGQKDIRAAGRTSVTNNVGSRFGTIPQGYELIESPQGAYMKAIPGGPADTSQMQAEQEGNRETKSDVAATAFRKARNLIGGMTTGVAGQAVSSLPLSSSTSAAELRRQVDVLKSMASIESLNAMRRQSPTGGALGNVTERENAMLANVAGALDPNASPEQFKSALNNYYHTLLRIVNGPEAGDKLFQQMQQQGVSAPAGPEGNTTSTGVQWRVVQ